MHPKKEAPICYMLLIYMAHNNKMKSMKWCLLHRVGGLQRNMLYVSSWCPGVSGLKISSADCYNKNQQCIDSFKKYPWWEAPSLLFNQNLSTLRLKIYKNTSINSRICTIKPRLFTKFGIIACVLPLVTHCLCLSFLPVWILKYPSWISFWRNIASAPLAIQG